MGDLPPALRRYLVLEQGFGSIVVNFPLNAAIAWAMARGLAAVPLQGDVSIAGDTLGTSFFLPLFTCLIGTRLVRGAVRRGHAPRLGWTRATHPLLRVLPRGTLARGLVAGIACALTIGPLAVRGITALGLAPLGVGPFVVLKATYAAALGVVVTPLLAVWALADTDG